MTDLTGLVRSELTTLADSGPPPADLADRAVTAGVRRRRWRRAAAGTAVAAAVAVTVAATQVLAPPPPRATDPRPAAVEARTVVFAKFRDGSGVEILDPATGAYRTVAVSVVLEPSADLRYAPVVPPGDAGGNRIGRYDTTSGEIRWFDPPLRWASPPTISPDGRYLAAPVYDTRSASWGAMVVDAGRVSGHGLAA